MAKTTLANVVSAGAPAMTGPAAIRAYASRVSTSREEVTVEATLPIAPSDRPWTGVTDYHCTNIGMNVQLCVRTDHPPRCTCGTASRPSSVAEHSLMAVYGGDLNLCRRSHETSRFGAGWSLDVRSGPFPNLPWAVAMTPHSLSYRPESPC